jgi:hypothetical protein
MGMRVGNTNTAATPTATAAKVMQRAGRDANGDSANECGAAAAAAAKDGAAATMCAKKRAKEREIAPRKPTQTNAHAAIK